MPRVPTSQQTKHRSRKTRKEPYFEKERIKYEYLTIPGDVLSRPFASSFKKNLDPEFVEIPNMSIPKPLRPPPLALCDLECIKTLGQGQYRVLLVRTKRKAHRLDRESFFALKVIPRKVIRKKAIFHAFQPSDEELSIDDPERSNLALLPWNPFIAGLLQTFHDAQNLYLGLEYIPGPTLRSHLRSHNLGLPARDANFYFSNIVCALEFLHSHKIVHRDLKPENFLLGPDGYLVLTDFGTSVRCPNEEIQWKGVGTHFYMAPECHEGMKKIDAHPKDIPYALDWWAAGCVLYELLTGEMAFCEAHEMLTILKAYEELDWPPRVQVSKRTMSFVDDLLEPEPSTGRGCAGGSTE
ncbi:hypothetical protein NLJ89_g10216 [Agrocybe chaxingu]|uniref:non-specific serine/threonine protein kinase n=1 Tax=Agrocybe chaxingu TaxID=84603 RepID=A0A9W8JS42_9AGAR|nr:hypothetical protein NLJ89_g10216 [Agrocybe chaxingu]